jgi:predicted RNase H-like nuclease
MFLQASTTQVLLEWTLNNLEYLFSLNSTIQTINTDSRICVFMAAYFWAMGASQALIQGLNHEATWDSGV